MVLQVLADTWQGRFQWNVVRATIRRDHLYRIALAVVAS